MVRPVASIQIQQPTAFLCSVYDAYDEEREKRLVARYSRKAPPELVFEFTRDPALLHQYYLIRSKVYIATHGLTSFPDTETEDDRSGHIMVVRRGNFCVGGVRINVKTPRRPKLLPMETDCFRIEKHFPQLQRRQMRYGQVSGLALLEEFHGGDVTRAILKRLVSNAIALNLDFLFASCPLSNARLYRHIFISMGLVDTRIHFDDIVLPDDPTTEGIKLYLLSIANGDSIAKNSAGYKINEDERQIINA